MKIINISGGYWTGSSAVLAQLEGLSEFKSIPVEYSCFAFGQSLKGNLDKSLAFRIFRYFHEADQHKFLRKAARHLCGKIGVYPKDLFIPRVAAKDYFGSTYREYVKSSCSQDIMNWDAKRTFNNIIIALAEDYKSEYVILDQAVSAAYINDFDNDEVYHIVVNRNPLDQYLEMKPLIRKLYERNISLGLRPLGEFVDLGLSDIDLFCAMRNHFDNVLDDLSDLKNVLILDFEDFVMNNSAVKANKLFPFLGVQELLNETEHYDPKLSLKNIGKWEKGLSQSEIQHITKSVSFKWKNW